MRILLNIATILTFNTIVYCQERQLSTPLSQSYVIVQHGDTLSTVAQSCHSTPEKLIRDNGIKPPYKIYIGQPLKVTLPTTAVRIPSNYIKEPTPKVSQGALKGLNSLQLIDPRPSLFKPLKKPQPEKILAENSVLSMSRESLTTPSSILPIRKPKLPHFNKELILQLGSSKNTEIKMPIAQPISQKEKNFLWPLKGKILSRFGTKSSSKYNRGINISAVLGDSVVACENGIIAYAGNEIKGFGNMILIKHANGWMSAYAHNRHLLVSRGDNVRRGQKIAEAGATGNVKEPQLHFELRQKTRAVDPQKYLGY